MTMQGYSTVASRNLIRAEKKMLEFVDNIQVLGQFGQQKEHPLRETDTVTFRRVKPFNANSNETPNITAANFVASEGATPDANTIDYTDVTVTVKQYVVLFKFSSKAQLMYEDDIPGDMQELTARTLAEVAELVAYGEMKAGSTVGYANGTTRAGVNTAISKSALRTAQRTLEVNRGMRVTKKIAAGPNFNTAPVAPAFVWFIHTDVEGDVRDLPGFIGVEEYGSAFKPVHDREIGKWENHRFVTSPLFAPFQAAGSTTLNSMIADDSTNVDVYPSIGIAEDCMGHVSLKGRGYKTGIRPTLIPATQKNHANPSGMFGYVGADFWYSAVRLNENWMYRLESGATE